LLNQLFTGLFEFRLLVADNLVKELITKTHQGDIEVNYHSLTEDFGRIDRVLSLSCKEEFEILMKLNLFITQWEIHDTSSVDYVLFEHGVEKRINFSANVLE